MRGVIWDGKKLHVDQLEVRDPGPGEVRVRVTASGICHSDLIPVDHGSDRLPMVLGHEAAGVIDCLGPDVDGWSVGQHVTVGCQTPCYHCGDCERENYSACPEAWTAARAPFTWRGKPVYSCANSSSFAQQIVVKVSQLYDTSGIPDVEAALIGCAISTGVGAARNLGKIRRGENVVVIGLGGIGVNAIQGARLGGAARILAVDIEATKLATAELYGATDLVTVEPSDRADEVARKILAVTPRVDVVIECSGARTAMEAATQLPYIGGRSVFIGLPPPDSRIHFSGNSFTWGRTFISGLNGGTTPGASFQRLVDEVRAGLIKVRPQITRVWPLDEVEDAIAALRGGKVTRAVLDMK